MNIFSQGLFLLGLVGLDGLEPSTSRLSGARSNLLSYRPVFFPYSLSLFEGFPRFRSFSLPYLGGDDGIRTHDPLLAGQVLSQLSYTPSVSLLPFLGPWKLNNNLSRLPCTPSYSYLFLFLLYAFQRYLYYFAFRLPFIYYLFVLHRKEVIQPHLPIRLPCYDLTLIINPTFGGVLLAVRLPTSGVANSHGVTGGVYKARERIHRGMLIHDY